MALNLKVTGKPINGVVKLQLEKSDEFVDALPENPVGIDFDMIYSSSLCRNQRKLNFDDNILDGNLFYIKTSTYSSSCTLQLQVNAAFYGYRYTMEFIKLDTISIPPMTFEQEFKINDEVDFCQNPNNDRVFSDGKVMEILDGDMFKIKGITGNNNNDVYVYTYPKYQDLQFQIHLFWIYHRKKPLYQI